MKKRYWIISLFMLLLACAYFFNYFYTIERTQKINEIIGHQKIHAKQASQNFIELFEKWNSVLFYLSRDRNVILLNESGVSELKGLMDVLKDEIKGITRTNKQGQIIFTFPANQNSIGADISKQKHMLKILADPKPVVSDVFTTVQGYKAIVIHHPVFKEGVFDGTIAFILDFEQITKDILHEIRNGNIGNAWMISSEGVELYCPVPGHFGEMIHETAKNFPDFLSIVNRMVSGEEGVASYSYKKGGHTVKEIVYFLPVKINHTFWSLAVSNSENEIVASLADFRNKLVVIFAFIFVGGAYFTYFGLKAWLIVRESGLRKVAETKLQESEEMYKAVVETTDTGYAVLDEQGYVYDANMNYTKMTGRLKPEDIVGRRVTEWTAPHDCERYLAELCKCAQNGSVQNLEIDYRHQDGTVVPVEINANIVRVKGRVAIIKLCRDITERRRAEDTIMQERTLLRILIDNLPSGVFVKDAQYRKIIVNPIHVDSVRGHLKYLGMNADIDILGKTDFEVFPAELAESFWHDDQMVIRDGLTILNNLETGVNPEGGEVWLLVSKVPIRDKNGDILGMVGVTTDITEQKKIEEALTIAKEKAEGSDRLKTAFLNNISHEIRTPLNAVIGFTGLLKDAAMSTEKLNDYLDIINQSSNQLLMIITDIINIATIEAGQVKVHLTDVDVNSVLRILHEQYKAKASGRNVYLGCHKALSGSDAVIVTDNAKFVEVLSNLINNALKFTENGYVNFGYELKDGFLQFYVEDTGIGIKPEFHQAIFERFYQAESKMSQKQGGTGLGLSISKAYAEVLGGRIWLTSAPGVGSTFYFTIPYRKAQGQEALNQG